MALPSIWGGGVPSTIEARREAFIGWTGTEILPSVILAAALVGHPDTQVVFRYRSATSTATFIKGPTPEASQSSVVDLHNGWSVQVLGPINGSGVSGNRNALVVLLGGIFLSFVLGILIYVLATSRSRALLLVEERTDQLHYQAFHDSLTGLPNRALILDRIAQMLARARRQHGPVAALFVDLDDFKNVNDTLGHDAGDQLLAGVAARMASTLREGDTVGRLGGDEFVVLVEGPSMAAGSEVVAQRILDVFESPFDIEGSRVPLVVTASIGIAEGDRAEPGDLLRDADAALYRAKDAGGHHAVVFTPSMRHSTDSQQSQESELQGALEGGRALLP